MRHGICTLSVVPCRKQPSGTSEMVTQLLFGETYTVHEESDDWLRITTTTDQYGCWMSAKQHSSIPEQVFRDISSVTHAACNQLVGLMRDEQSGRNFPVTIGASLPFYRNGIVSIGDLRFTFDGETTSKKRKTANAVLDTALLMLNAPYLWGGRSPFGIDCSGFTQLVFALNGIGLSRDAYQQVETGTPLSFVEESKAGDVAFFDNSEGRITHVGILLDNERIVHASGLVKIERFDHYGIFSDRIKGYSHHLRVIKRIL